MLAPDVPLPPAASSNPFPQTTANFQQAKQWLADHPVQLMNEGSAQWVNQTVANAKETAQQVGATLSNDVGNLVQSGQTFIAQHPVKLVDDGTLKLINEQAPVVQAAIQNAQEAAQPVVDAAVKQTSHFGASLLEKGQAFMTFLKEQWQGTGANLVKHGNEAWAPVKPLWESMTTYLHRAIFGLQAS